MVNIKFIKKVLLKPCLRKTARGGNSIFRMIVKIDMCLDCFKQSYLYHIQIILKNSYLTKG